LLDGIAAFSHVWLIFVFHANSENGSESHQKAKVHAPRLMGDSTGVLASRSPHRVNPVGLTVCRLDRIENRTLYLSGVDLIEGTPVLDVKPYHPADVIPSDVLVAPTWVTSPSSLSVSFSDAAEQQLSEIVSHRPLVHYKADDLAAIRQAIADVLSLDPRSVHSRSAHSDGIYNLAFDRLNVVFRMRTQDSCQVWKIEYCPPDVHRVRTVPAIRNILLN
jgi:tRNA (Thr-GGU) A37 N-methylase